MPVDSGDVQQDTLPRSPSFERKQVTDRMGLGVDMTVAGLEVGDEAEFTEEEYGKLKRKVDRYLLPLMWFCYGVQQTDKTSLSTQALFGLREDTGLVGQQFSWLTTIFYITYLCCEFPSNILMQKIHIGRTLSIMMFLWGVVIMSIASAKNWAQLMALRALQGATECSISPGFVLIIATWYKREEHASRTLVWQSANAGFGMIADLSIYGIAKHSQTHGGLAPWRAISLFLGSLTMVLSVACMFLLGTPKEVRWLSAREKRMANARIIANKAGHDTTGYKWTSSQVTEAFQDPQTYFFFANTLLASIPNGGITTFGSLVNQTFGFTGLEVILYGLPRSCVSVICFIIVGLATTKWQNLRLYFMGFCTVPPLLAFLMLLKLPEDPSYRWAKWGAYMMGVVFVIPLFLSWTLISSNVAGRTKRSVVSSVTFVGYCVGNMIGSQIFTAQDAPHYTHGIMGCLISLGLEFVLIVLWRLYYMYQNSQRNELVARSGLSAEEQDAEGRLNGEKNMTDTANLHFRYTM